VRLGEPPKPEPQHVSVGVPWENNDERYHTLERLTQRAAESTTRRAVHNHYRSETAANVAHGRTNMSKAERKKVLDRLVARPAHARPRCKSATNLGHVLASGVMCPWSRPDPHTQTIPWSKAAVSPAACVTSSLDAAWPEEDAACSARSTEGVESTSLDPPSVFQRSADGVFEGLTKNDFYNSDWTPSFEYKPARHSRPWDTCEGFSRTSRTFERRKMDPFSDINSYQGNAASTAEQFAARGHVRPLDAKGESGAGPVQFWKETLREDFSNDNDNYSSNLRDAMLDALRTLVSTATGYSVYASRRGPDTFPLTPDVQAELTRAAADLG